MAVTHLRPRPVGPEVTWSCVCLTRPVFLASSTSVDGSRGWVELEPEPDLDRASTVAVGML